MGCGGSKLDPALPPKLRPLLRKRFEEIRMRRRKGCTLKGQTTLSKKELLDPNVSDDDSNDRKSVSSDEDNGLMKVAPAPPESEETMTKEIKIVKAVEIKPVLLVCPTFANMLPVSDAPCKDIEEDIQAVQKVEVTTDSMKQSKEHEVENKKTEAPPHVEIVTAPPVVAAEVEIVSAPPVVENKNTEAPPLVEIISASPVVVAEVEANKFATEESAKEDKNDGKVKEREKNVVVVEILEGNVEDVEVSETKGEAEEEEEIDDDQEEECSCVDERFLCPGSPSFRVYCVQYDNDRDNDVEDKEDESIDKKWESEDTDGVDGNESVHSTTEESVTETKKKVKRGGRFRKVKLIPKAKPMKNLLKMKSCYNPACGGSHEKVRLLSLKSSAA